MTLLCAIMEAIVVCGGAADGGHGGFREIIPNDMAVITP